jgi:hypothetical protein
MAPSHAYLQYAGVRLIAQSPPVYRNQLGDADENNGTSLQIMWTAELGQGTVSCSSCNNGDTEANEVI